MENEPASYNLQQFLIFKEYRGQGYGKEALRMILTELEKERKYSCVEVCIRKDNTAALRAFENAGFKYTGYEQEEATVCLKLIYHFYNDQRKFSDILISDFTDPLFQNAFKTYFSELEINVKDWDCMFREMNEEGDNQAFIRIGADGEIVGFIQFKPTKFTSWFFEETYGFIREFWISEAHRKTGHGAALLKLAENYFREHDMFTSILTTDTAEGFYLKQGYQKAPGCKAKNQDAVFIKHLV